MIQLSDIRQLDEIVENSHTLKKGVLIFKHSTRCSISGMAYNRFTRNWNENSEEFPVYYLDLLRYREISDEISRRFGVKHESPQVLLIKNGVCVYHESHNGISPTAVLENA